MPITPDQFRHIEQVFNRAIDIAPEQREAFVVEQSAGDDVVAADVFRLLRNDQNSLHADGSSFATGRLRQRALPGRIGPYVLLGELGEGGFGTVYHARQESPIQREVALKILKAGMDSEQIVARFEAERQALAMMEHPNIAKVHDAGTTADGRPFFVMELVRGDSITAFCDAQRLDLRGRIELLIPVCEAVQHAHHKGVIHRDLKPSNILVAQHEGHAVPKIIDFGIAKAVDRRLLERPIQTEVDQLVGTPDYMSPEQADSGMADIDTRTDVYSLGVVLYELMTGSLPIDARRLRSGGYESMLRMIRETEPERPSTRVGEGVRSRVPRGDAATIASQATSATSAPDGKREPTRGTVYDIASIAAYRRADPAMLRRQLRGDLDWIVMKALEKDRARRYDTAVSLAGDLRRYLRNEPVLAGPPSARYRLGKFAMRHRGLLVATGLIAVSLIGGLIAATWGYLIAGQQRDAAVAARTEAMEQGAIAQREAAKARAVNRFIEELFASIQPQNARGRDISVRAVFDQADEKLLNRTLREQPEIEAAIRHTLGRTYHMLGWNREAEAQYRTALKLRRAVLPADHVDIVETLQGLAGYCVNWGDPGEALTLLEEALAMRRRLGIYDDPRTADLLHDLARAYRDPVKYEALLREAYDLRVRLLGPDDPTCANEAMDLAFTRVGRDPPEAIIATGEAAVAAHRRAYGTPHPQMAGTLYCMAELLMDLREPARAEPYYVEAAEVYGRVFGSRTDSKARALNALGVARLELRRPVEAEAPLREALESLLELGADADRGLLAFVRSNLGEALRATSRFDEAEHQYLKSRELLTERNADLRISSQQLRLLYEAWGRPEEAAKYAATQPSQ